MRILALAAVGAALLAGGVALGYALDSPSTATTPSGGVPEAVEETRAAVLDAAESGDYEALRPLLPATFRYSFGGPVEGGPIAYWQELERTTDERPLETLAAILELPYVLSRGLYVWPWAYSVESADDLTEHERALLAPLGLLDTLFPPESGYYGWRTGIEPDGTWAFFVAGD